MSISYASQAPWKIPATYLKCAEVMPSLVKLLLLEIPAALEDAPSSGHKLQRAHRATAPGRSIPAKPAPHRDSGTGEAAAGGSGRGESCPCSPGCSVHGPHVHTHTLVSEPELSLFLLCPE